VLSTADVANVRRQPMKRLSTVIVIGLALAACGPQDRGDVAPATSPGATVSVGESWLADLVEHREAKDEEYATSPTSPMAGTQYLPSDPADAVYLTRDGDAFGLAYEPVPEAVLSVAKKQGAWHWHDQGSEATCRKGDDVLPDGAALEGPVRFDVDRFTCSAYPKERSVTFIVFDPERPEKKSFEHLLYYPPDQSYAVQARLVRTPVNDEITMLTSQNLEKTFYRYAKLVFELEGQEQRLTAFKSTLSGEGSSWLFIPFKDATTGRETYGAGRFLDMDEPEEERFVLDFNRCYNPLCNYSPAYNCARPPRENHLKIAIRAGEKTYSH
jgi:uncharacterized protein (DUF1684 family)